jgi:hypothetical protein
MTGRPRLAQVSLDGVRSISRFDLRCRLMQQPRRSTRPWPTAASRTRPASSWTLARRPRGREA